jgi:hypothetical protein
VVALGARVSDPIIGLLGKHNRRLSVDNNVRLWVQPGDSGRTPEFEFAALGT